MSSSRQKLIQDQWKALKAKEESGLQLIRHEPESGQIWVGRDDEGCLYCFSPLRADVERPEVCLIDGLWVRHQRLRIGDEDGGLWHVVRAAEEREAVFAPFVAAFIDAQSSDGPAEALWATLKMFRRLWLGSQAPLDAREVRGLYGELVVLRELLRVCPKDRHENLLASWVAGQDALHDFTAPSLHIEVKTVVREPVVIHVNDIHQVFPLEAAKLKVAVVALTATTGGRTLPALVDQLRSMVNPSSLVSLDHRLQEWGYRHEDALHYSTAFSVDAVWLYPIEEGAPVLDPALLADAPGTVSGINYLLAMSGFQRYSPTQARWSDVAERMAECLLEQRNESD